LDWNYIQGIYKAKRETLKCKKKTAYKALNSGVISSFFINLYNEKAISDVFDFYEFDTTMKRQVIKD